MRLARAAACVAATLIACGGASAQTVPPAVGADLLRSCNALLAYAAKGGEVTLDATSCAAYLKGLRDAADAPGARNGGRLFCAGAARLDELARVVVKHVEATSESARKRASGEALAALGRAYPCEKD